LDEEQERICEIQGNILADQPGSICNYAETQCEQNIVSAL